MRDMTSAPGRAAVAPRSRHMNWRIRCTLVLLAFALLIPSGAAAQHFPSDEDLTALIRSRVEVAWMSSGKLSRRSP